MAKSITPHWLQLCIAAGLGALLGFAASARADVPDTGGYVIGNPGDSIIFVYPTGYAPPSGSLTGLAKSALADGNAFYLNDNSAPGRLPVRFYVKKSPLYADPVGGFPIDISSATITTANHVAIAIAAAINGVGSGLHVLANASPPPSGVVYLSYDYDSDVLSTGNDVTIYPDVANPYPSSGALAWTPGSASHNDLQHVQWAIDTVAPGGTVVLKQSGIGGDSTSFKFGVIGNVSLNKDVNVIGEVSARAGFSDIGSGGWSLSGTRILGGRQMSVGWNGAVTYSIKDIIFDGFYNQAIRVYASKGYNEISGCQFINFVNGRTFYETIVGGFPMIVHGGATEEEIERLGGALTVKNNFFGKPAAPADNFNNVMHFSNGNFDLEISGNEIEDAVWGGFVVSGNKGHSRITHNTITKTKSYLNGLNGMAIMVGTITPNLFSPYAYNGSAEVTNNKITVGASDTYAITMIDYPPSQYKVPVPEGIRYVISGNSITMNGGQTPPLACLGACSNSVWSDNAVTGSAPSGIFLSKGIPARMQQFNDQAQIDASVSDNLFENIDLTGLAVSNNYVRCEAGSSDNVGTDIQVPAGTTCSKFISDDGINNVFNQPEITSVSAKPDQLWPPDHEMKPVTLTVATRQGCGAVSCRILSVSSSQSADPAGDWTTTSDLALMLRAERLGIASDRIYTITVGCTDERNATTTAEVAVTVPHDQQK